MKDTSKKKFDSDHAVYFADQANRLLSRRVAMAKIGRDVLYGASAMGMLFGSKKARAQRTDRTPCSFRERIGFDAGRNAIEDALAFAATNDFHYLDFNADRGPNNLGNWSDARVERFRKICEAHDLHVGLHTLSGVNVAEFSPFVSEGIDRYLESNIDLAVRLACEWVIVHAGFHFSSMRDARRQAALERLKRLTGYAEQKGARLLLENLNREPDRAEVHYQAFDIEECHYFFDAISSKAFGWAFTVNHANLLPEGIHGFLDEFGIKRIGEVRLADNTGEYEVHLLPGEGNIDFESVFRRIEEAGYRGHYTMAFGSTADKLAARDKFVAMLF